MTPSMDKLPRPALKKNEAGGADLEDGWGCRFRGRTCTEETFSCQKTQ